MDQKITVDGWNCLSTDLAAYGWAEIFEKSGLTYEFPDEPASSDEDSPNNGLQGQGFPKATNATDTGMRHSQTVESLKDLAKLVAFNFYFLIKVLKNALF